jgi:hypothetical protein
MLSDILFGSLLGGIICFLNIKSLRYFTNRILIEAKDVRKAKGKTYMIFIFIFRYLIITGVLYLAVKSRSVNLVAFIIGFSLILFSSVVTLFTHIKEIGPDGRTSSIH